MKYTIMVDGEVQVVDDSWLTYEEYIQLGGTLDETPYYKYEFDAEQLINHYTFNRLKDEKNLSRVVKMCILRLVEKFSNQARLMTSSPDEQRAVTSESNDGVSASYLSLGAADLYTALGDELKVTIKHFLCGEKNSKGQVLLYRGLYPGE